MITPPISPAGFEPANPRISTVARNLSPDFNEGSVSTSGDSHSRASGLYRGYGLSVYL